MNRQQLLEEVAAAVPARAGGDGVRVAVDGVDGGGKTTFADELATVLRSRHRSVVRICADDFHHVREIRYRRGRDSPEGCWLDSYDYLRLQRDVLEPFRPGGSRRYRRAAHDLGSDAELCPQEEVAPPGAVLVLDGLFLHRDGLADLWDLSIWLEVPFKVTAARMSARDGSDPDPDHPSLARYIGAQRLYFAACDPRRRADLVIDNSVLDSPRLRQDQSDDDEAECGVEGGEIVGVRGDDGLAGAAGADHDVGVGGVGGRGVGQQTADPGGVGAVQRGGVGGGLADQACNACLAGGSPDDLRKHGDGHGDGGGGLGGSRQEHEHAPVASRGRWWAGAS